jgi:hypothetical protein
VAVAENAVNVRIDLLRSQVKTSRDQKDERQNHSTGSDPGTPFGDIRTHDALLRPGTGHKNILKVTL